MKNSKNNVPFTHSFGALPPPQFEWMMGKSVEEIESIKDEAEELGITPTEVCKSDTWKLRLNEKK